MHAAELSQLRGLLSSDDSDRQRGVAKSITVSISATQTRMPDVDTEMSINRRSPSLMSISTCIDHPWWRRPHGFFRNFTMTGTNFLLVPIHFARTRSSRSRSQYFTSTNHFSCGFVSTFYWRLASKASIFSNNVRWLVPLPWRHTPRLQVFRFLLRIFVYMLLSKHAR